MEEDLMNEPEFGGDNGEESDSYQENLCVENIEGKDIFSLDEEDVSDSSDVSFNPGESDSEVAEEYDSKHSTSNSDSEDYFHNQGNENEETTNDVKLIRENKQGKKRKMVERREKRKSKTVKCNHKAKNGKKDHKEPTVEYPLNEPEAGDDNGEENDSYQENLSVDNNEGKNIFSIDEEDVSDSSDVSFNTGESDSEVAEEYDSNYSIESDDHDHNSHNEGDENGADMTDCKMNTANKQRKNRKVKVRRKNRKSKSVKKGSETGMIMMAPGELDINKPRPPMLAFMIWISTIRDDIKKENPEASYVKVVMIAAERWRRMEAEEKTKWKEKAQKAKEDYKIALEEYLKNKAEFDDDDGKVDINNQKKSKMKEDSTIEKTMKNSDKPKRPMSSYMIWLSANRDNIKKENPEASSTKLLKIAGGLWHGMEGKEKTKWNKEAKKAMGNYKVAMNEYLTNKPEDSDDGGEVKMYQMRLSVRNIKSKSKACDKENDDASSFSTRKGEKDVYLPRKNDTVVTEENSKKNKKGPRRSSTKKTTRSKAWSGGRSKRTNIFTGSSSDSDDSGEEVKRYQEKLSVKNILRKSMAHYNEDDDAYFYLTLKRQEGKYGAIEDDEDDYGSDSSDGCFYPGESGSEVAEEYDSNPPTSSSDSEYYSMASHNERDDSRREGEADRQTKGRKTNKKNSKKKTKSPQKSSPKKATRSRGGSGRRIKWTLFGSSTDSDSDTPPKKKLKRKNQKEKPIVRKKKNERKRRK